MILMLFTGEKAFSTFEDFISSKVVFVIKTGTYSVFPVVLAWHIPSN